MRTGMRCDNLWQVGLCPPLKWFRKLGLGEVTAQLCQTLVQGRSHTGHVQAEQRERSEQGLGRRRGSGEAGDDPRCGFGDQ